MIVFPVRIIMSPTSSSTFFAGRNARSATLRTIVHPVLGTQNDSRPPGRLCPPPYAIAGRADKREPTGVPGERRPGLPARALWYVRAGGGVRVERSSHARGGHTRVRADTDRLRRRGAG